MRISSIIDAWLSAMAACMSSEPPGLEALRRAMDWVCTAPAPGGGRQQAERGRRCTIRPGVLPCQTELLRPQAEGRGGGVGAFLQLCVWGVDGCVWCV